MEKVKKRSGISLIVLVITILVMIILAGVVVVTMSENNPIEKAKEARFKEDLAAIGGELDMYIANISATNSSFQRESLFADKKKLEVGGKVESGKSIYDILPSLKSSKYKNQVEVIAGILFYKTPDKKEIPWLKEIGVRYTGIVTGTVVIEGNTLVGVSPDYVNTGTFVIPSNVTKIAPGAFAGCQDIYDVVIPASITEIPANCFRDCSNLEKVTIPDTVTKIGVSAFRACGKLDNVTLPRDLITIEDEAFYWCRSLVNISFNSNLVTIGKKAFSYTMLNKIELKEGVKEICQQAFEEVPAETVILPESVTNIRTYAFYRAKSKTVKVGSKAQIEEGAFRRMAYLKKFTVDAANPYHTASNNALYNKDMSTLVFAPSDIEVTSFTVPSTVKNIASSAFRQASGLQTVVLPEGLVTIGDNVFEECYNLQAVHIPSTVTTIGIRMLEGCPAKVTIAEGNKNYKADQNAIFTADGKKILSVANTNTTFVVPGTVTEIANSAFAKCTKMSSISFAEGTNTLALEVDCFRESGLVTVTVPGRVQLVRWGAFRGSKSLTKVTFAEGVKTLHGSLFENCDSLTDVVIPSTVTSVSGDLFAVAKSLTNISISSANNTFKVVDNMLLSKSGNSLYAVPDNKKIVNVPNGVKQINGYAFLNSTNIQEVRIPAGVTTIDDYAFLFSRGLQRITIPSTVTQIGAHTFENCSVLSNIIIDKEKGSIAGSPWGAPLGTKIVIWK